MSATMTEVYTVRSDRKVGHQVYPESAHRGVEGKELRGILAEADFYAVGCGDEYGVYLANSSGDIGLRLGSCPKTLEALIKFCESKKGSTPGIIYIF